MMQRAPYGPRKLNAAPCDGCDLAPSCEQHRLACEGFVRWAGSEEEGWLPSLGLCTRPSKDWYDRVFEKD